MNQILPHHSGSSGHPSILLRPLYAARLDRSFVLELQATELLPLVVGPGVGKRLDTARKYLHDSTPNRELQRLARESPEAFGLIDWITLGADSMSPASGPGGRFADRIRLDGAELIDGNQRLRTVALVLDELGEEHLAKMRLKVEVFFGAERDQARLLHGTADRYRNLRTAQDRLILCSNIRRLAHANWERLGFDPRRGVSAGPNSDDFSMAEVTRALACLSLRGPEAAHMASTVEGLTGLWEDQRSLLYLDLFHAEMTPLGVVRAVEARRAARGALEELPKSRQKGHGRLIMYAPELIYWASCRYLPLDRLHEESRQFDWNGALRQHMKEATLKAVDRLVKLYERFFPVVGATAGHYSKTAPDLSVWTALVEG
ncbi:hypothetical protein ACFC1T_02355 [Kitasatospora sp. NPDC056076]|uniref:hypothetical protein n=1 Tax=Kitasatospora sp. NPDC056076 TaxID=3345703 RepID=UPI0035DBDE68